MRVLILFQQWQDLGTRLTRQHLRRINLVQQNAIASRQVMCWFAGIQARSRYNHTVKLEYLPQNILRKKNFPRPGYLEWRIEPFTKISAILVTSLGVEQIHGKITYVSQNM